MAAKKKSKGQKAGPKPAAPAFDEAALSKLTAKIETGLSQSKPKQSSKHQDQRPTKRKRADSDPKDANPHPQKKLAQEPRHRPGKPGKASKDKTAEMLQEIKALGGDEADLDLVAGIDSDADDDAKPAKSAPADMDNVFKTELAKFAAGLGFEDVRDQDGATDDEGDDDDDDEPAVNGDAGDKEWENEQPDEQEDEQEDEAPPAEKLHGRGKLVSMRQVVCPSCLALFCSPSRK